MIQAIGTFYDHEDYEYKRIKMELIQLGIRPTGNKRVDKAKLIEKKTEKAEKVLEDRIQNDKGNNVDEDKKKLEELKTGAVQLAQLNRILHGI